LFSVIFNKSVISKKVNYLNKDDFSKIKSAVKFKTWAELELLKRFFQRAEVSNAVQVTNSYIPFPKAKIGKLIPYLFFWMAISMNLPTPFP